QIGEARTRQRLAASVQKDLRDPGLTPDRQPGAKSARRLLPEWEATLLPPLPPHEDARIRPVEFEVVDAETHELRDPEPCRETEVEHGLVSEAASRAGVRGIEE